MYNLRFSIVVITAIIFFLIYVEIYIWAQNISQKKREKIGEEFNLLSKKLLIVAYSFFYVIFFVALSILTKLVGPLIGAAADLAIVLILGGFLTKELDKCKDNSYDVQNVAILDLSIILAILVVLFYLKKEYVIGTLCFTLLYGLHIKITNISIAEFKRKYEEVRDSVKEQGRAFTLGMIAIIVFFAFPGDYLSDKWPVEYESIMIGCFVGSLAVLIAWQMKDRKEKRHSVSKKTSC